MARRKTKPTTVSPPVLSAVGKEGELTIGDVLRYLSDEILKDRFKPTWPPDVFAITACILEKCGAYIKLVSEWPPGKSSQGKSRQDWINEISTIAERWRQTAVASGLPPVEVLDWWRLLLSYQSLPLGEVQKTHSVYDALLQLCSAADQASAGAGIPNKNEKDDDFQREILKILALQNAQGTPSSTLSKAVHSSKLCVLPKLHSPQSGMTIRSVSHHLAVCRSGDVETRWVPVPQARPEAHCLNLLLIPWPKDTAPINFRMREKDPLDMPSNYGFFIYSRPSESPQQMCSLAMDLYKNAEELVGRIDGVILPELALTREEYFCLWAEVRKRGAFLLSGIREPGSDETLGRNYLRLDLPYGPSDVFHEQAKHHRWLLDKRQVVQYGLGGTLDFRRSWWEAMELEHRTLKFFAMRPWLTMCALVCEDLARQDPVAEIVRAVGPNLVIALLMDGPQLPERWSARYATVLADDPGSSVLTLTSIGMAKLSRPPHVGTESRVIGLWKDSHTGDPVRIELPDAAEAVVLSLVELDKEEWTADGRTDKCKAGVPVFGGVHPVSRSKDFRLGGTRVPRTRRKSFVSKELRNK
jgi:hypothetical protein